MTDRAPIYVSRHVVVRIAQRAGEYLTWQDVIEMIPPGDLERMARGEHVVTKVKRLALDLVCRNRCVTTAMDTHNWRRDPRLVGDREWRRRKSDRPAEARRRQAVFDVDEDLVVGGRVRRVDP